MTSIEQLEERAIAAAAAIALQQNLFTREQIGAVLTQELRAAGFLIEEGFVLECSSRVLQRAVLGKAKTLGFGEDLQYTFHSGFVGVDSSGRSIRSWAISLADNEESAAAAFDAGRQFAIANT